MASISPSFIELTRQWVERVVIGLNLCPFASLPFRQGRIRWVLEESDSDDRLAVTFLAEAQRLLEEPSEQIETTLIIHPNVLTDFEDYLDFVADAEALLEQAGLEGIIQLASFHPAYRFAGTTANDITNYTNRSPFPMLHLLREDSVEQAAANYPHVEEIPERNQARMRELGNAGLEELLKP